MNSGSVSTSSARDTLRDAWGRFLSPSAVLSGSHTSASTKATLAVRQNAVIEPIGLNLRAGWQGGLLWRRRPCLRPARGLRVPQGLEGVALARDGRPRP